MVRNRLFQTSDEAPPPSDPKLQRWASDEGPSAKEVFLWTWRWMWENEPGSVRVALACIGYQAAWSMASMLLIEQLLINASSEDADPIIMGTCRLSAGPPVHLGTQTKRCFRNKGC